MLKISPNWDRVLVERGRDSSAREISSGLGGRTVGGVAFDMACLTLCMYLLLKQFKFDEDERTSFTHVF